MERVLESKVSAEGRVSIPAEIRQRWELEPGARVQFVIDDDGEVHLTTARRLAEHVWAQNTGGDAIDAGQVMRTARDHDDLNTRWSRVPFETSSPEEDALIAALFPEND